MVNVPRLTWIKPIGHTKWKPLHERIIDELINGTDNKHDNLITSNYHDVYSGVNIWLNLGYEMRLIYYYSR